MLLLTKGLHQLCSETTLFLPKVSHKTLDLLCESAMDASFPDFLTKCFFGYVTPSDLEGRIHIFIKFVGAGGQI